MISLARIQARLGVTGDATYLQELHDEVVDNVQEWTGLYLGTTTKTFREIHRGATLRQRLTKPEIDRLPCVWLGQPIETLGEITSIEHRATTSSDWIAYDLLDPDDSSPNFEVDGGRVYKLSGNWPVGPRRVRVTYDFGWSLDAAPARVESVIFGLIELRYRPPAQRKLPANVSAVRARGVSVELRDAGGVMISPELADRLNALRRYTNAGGARK